MTMEAGASACKAKRSSDNGAYSVFLSILEGVSLKTHDQNTANDTHNSQVLWDNSLISHLQTAREYHLNQNDKEKTKREVS